MNSARTPGRVSVVVLNWNSEALGAAAVASALAQTWSDVEVVVVDNASTDDSLDQILGVDPDAVVVRNTTNLGFGGGMNSGIAAATGEFVLPLNCDAELHPGYVTTLMPAFAADDRLGAAGGCVRSERAGDTGPQRITPVMRTVALPIETAGPAQKLNGACPLLRQVALDDVAAVAGRDRGRPYDDTYFVYGEDVDLAHSLHACGWTLHFDPVAIAEHVRSFGSSPRLADRRGRLRISTLHNRHRNIVRHGPAPWPAVAAFAFLQDAGFVAIRVVRGDFRIVPDMAKAWWGVPRTLLSDVTYRRRLRRRAEMGNSAH
ncbi:MAG: GT2 family glycosyltransferase [Candidatus Aldehydirespiratoraceae bacterium]|jgi:GT2 family glycosyltransferase